MPPKRNQQKKMDTSYEIIHETPIHKETNYLCNENEKLQETNNLCNKKLKETNEKLHNRIKLLEKEKYIEKNINLQKQIDSLKRRVSDLTFSEENKTEKIYDLNNLIRNQPHGKISSAATLGHHSPYQ